jgi:hypothetical protein
MPDITLLPSAKVPLVYDGELTMTTEWYRFFWNIYGFTGSGTIPVNKGGTGLNTIGDHQLIIGNTNGVFEPVLLSSDSLAITYPTGFINIELPDNNISCTIFIATQGQTIFTVPTYGVGTNALEVYVNGNKQINSTNYAETNATTVTFVSGLNINDYVEFRILSTISSSLSGVTGVVGTPPILSSGGSTPVISIPAATGSVNGYLTSADWVTFNNSSTILSTPGASGNVLTSVGGSWVSAPPTGSIPSGTVTNFIQASAPTGWTQVTTWNNYAFRVVSGVGGGTGGSVAFTTAFSSKTPTGTVATTITSVTGNISLSGGSVNAHTLSTSEMPSHAHFYGYIQGGGSGLQAGTGYSGTAGDTNSTGGGGSHSHGFSPPTGAFSFTSGIATSAFTGTAINLAVQYVDNIIASKN